MKAPKHIEPIAADNGVIFKTLGKWALIRRIMLR